MSQLEILRKSLIDSGQEHLLTFYNELGEVDKENYVKQLFNIDLQEMKKLYRAANESYSADVRLLDDHMKPLPASQCGSEERFSKEELEKFQEEGLGAISRGEVGVVLMAGGQGTRLGVDYPKGMYNVGILSGKTLFQIQAERIRKLQELASARYNRAGKITWYIMTSGPTNEQTKKFLEKNDYFGLNGGDVVIFKQGLLPCFDFNGKLIMDGKDKIAMAPDGNGGIYRALKLSGILDDFKSRGIKYLHVHSVDNILIKVADPTFIGYCISSKADCAAKVVRKSCPTEAVGVVCLVDNKAQVVEYSEITPSTAALENENGLVFNAGNICNHFFTADFLDRISNKEMKLHVAKKKIPYVDEHGKFVKPQTPNGIKIEKFVFDVFQFSERFFMYEVPRDSEFSALKNADDARVDCPLTARRDLYRLHRKYLEAQNVTVVGEEVEISPLLSYGGEGLERYQGTTLVAPYELK